MKKKTQNLFSLDFLRLLRVLRNQKRLNPWSIYSESLKGEKFRSRKKILISQGLKKQTTIELNFYEADFEISNSETPFSSIEKSNLITKIFCVDQISLKILPLKKLFSLTFEELFTSLSFQHYFLSSLKTCPLVSWESSLNFLFPPEDSFKPSKNIPTHPKINHKQTSLLLFQSQLKLKTR